MEVPNRSGESTPPGRRWRTPAFFAVVVAVAAVHWGLPRWRSYLETLGDWDVKAGPIAVVNATGDPVLASVVVRSRIDFDRPTRRGYADDQIVELQLNHPDASDAGRMFVARSEESGVLNLNLLGTSTDRVWIFVTGLRAVRMSSMTVDVDPATIEARVPELRGLLSDDVRYYELQPDGTVRLVARDGRFFLLDPTAWTLAPAAEKTPGPQAKTQEEYAQQVVEYDRAMAEALGPRDATQPGEFGLDSWRNGERWLGVLSDAQARDFSRRWQRPRQASFGRPDRRKIWTAAPTMPPEESAEGVTLADFRIVGTREYLRGGVLRDGFHLRAARSRHRRTSSSSTIRRSMRPPSSC